MKLDKITIFKYQCEKTLSILKIIYNGKIELGKNYINCDGVPIQIILFENIIDKFIIDRLKKEGILIL